MHRIKVLYSEVFDPLARFTGLPIHTEYIDGIQWKLDRRVSYKIQTGGFAGHTTTVHAGFIFDWASIPRVFWNLLPPTGLSGNPYGIAALFHDWICRHREIQGQPCSRLDADQVFLEIMLYVGVTPWVAKLMYRCVRLAGVLPWYNFDGSDDSGDYDGNAICS